MLNCLKYLKHLDNLIHRYPKAYRHGTRCHYILKIMLSKEIKLVYINYLIAYTVVCVYDDVSVQIKAL